MISTAEIVNLIPSAYGIDLVSQSAELSYVILLLWGRVVRYNRLFVTVSRSPKHVRVAEIPNFLISFSRSVNFTVFTLYWPLLVASGLILFVKCFVW